MTGITFAGWGVGSIPFDGWGFEGEAGVTKFSVHRFTLRIRRTVLEVVER